MIGNKLEPFKFWCQKVLPNVYDDSLSYYEYLCKLNEYLNEVIGQINTLTDNMEDYEADLTATWLETKNYIDNYFNNLDVQQEINNKLDQMAQSGALSTLLAPIVGTQIGGVVAEQIDATVANQIGNTVASQIDNVVANQISEPTATATSAWLTAHVDPVGSAVIVDDTLSITGAAADAKVTGDTFKTFDNFNAIETIADLTYTDNTVTIGKNGYYVSPHGVLTQYENCYVSEPIAVNENDIVSIDIQVNTGTCVVCYGNDNYGSFVVVDDSYNDNSGRHKFSFVSNRTGYIYLTGYLASYSSDTYKIVTNDAIKKVYGYINNEIADVESEITTINSNISNIDSEIDSIENILEIDETSNYVSIGKNGYYIHYNGTMTQYAGTYISEPISVNENDIVEADVYVNTGTIVVCYGNDNYGGFVNIDSSYHSESGRHKFVFKSNKNGYIYITGYLNQSENDKYKIITNNAIRRLDNDISEISEIDYQNIDLTFEDKTGYYSADGNFNTYSNIKGATLNVTGGEKYLLRIKKFFGVCVAVYFDSSNNWIASIPASGSDYAYNEYNLIVPENASTMLIQEYSNYYDYLKKNNGIKPVSIFNILKDKKITVIGDSITGYNFRAKTNWSMYINEWCGAIMQNLGRGGTGFAKTDPYIDRISDIQDSPDIIGVAMSWNDLDAGLPIGTSADTGTSSIAGYVNDFFDALITAYPLTPIICYCQGPWQYYRYGASSSDSLLAVIKEICALKGVPFYDDLYMGSVLRPWNADNREEYYKSDNDDLGNTGVVDNVHPNSKGHKAIARVLYPKFATNVVDVGMDYEN